MTDKNYVNPFEAVHKKVEAFRDRAREANEKDAEVRERRAVHEAGEALDKKE